MLTLYLFLTIWSAKQHFEVDLNNNYHQVRDGEMESGDKVTFPSFLSGGEAKSQTQAVQLKKKKR